MWKGIRRAGQTFMMCVQPLREWETVWSLLFLRLLLFTHFLTQVVREYMVVIKNYRTLFIICLFIFKQSCCLAQTDFKLVTTFLCLPLLLRSLSHFQLLLRVIWLWCLPIVCLEDMFSPIKACQLEMFGCLVLFSAVCLILLLLVVVCFVLCRPGWP